MGHLNYTKHAARRFLSGTRCRTPVEAVETGVRPLSEWTRILAEERERHEVATRAAATRRPPSLNSRAMRARASSEAGKERP